LSLNLISTRHRFRGRREHLWTGSADPLRQVSPGDDKACVGGRLIGAGDLFYEPITLSKQEKASRGCDRRGDRETIFHRRPIIQRWAQDGLQLPRSSTEPHVIAVDGLGSLIRALTPRRA